MKNNRPIAQQLLLSQALLKIGRSCREFMDALQLPEAAGLRSMGVHLMGYSFLRPPYVISRPRSRFDLLLLPVEGELRLTLPERITSMRAGEAWVIPAHSLSRYELLNGTLKMCWFHFDPGSVPARLHSGAATRIAEPSALNARLFSDLQRLKAEQSGVETRARTICHRLYELVHLEVERLFLGTTGTRQSIVKRLDCAWEQVEQNKCHGWDVSSIAKKAQLSPSRFNALCLEHYGVTPHHKLTQLLIDEAIVRLLATDEKLETIARALGYSSAFALSKVFKKVVGTSPKHFRESRIGAKRP